MHASGPTQREQPRALCAMRLPHLAASSGWPSIPRGTGGRRARNPREMAGTSQAASEGRFRGKPITSLGALPSLPSGAERIRQQAREVLTQRLIASNNRPVALRRAELVHYVV